MIDLLLALPDHMRRRLAHALESGLLGPPYAASSIAAVLGIRQGIEKIRDSLLALGKQGIAGRGAAACIRAVDEAMSRIPRPDLVWSGPEVAGLHARDTRRVYEELTGSARSSLWICTYAFFDGPRAFELVARRMDREAALRVTILLNIQRKAGDTSTSEDLVRRFADRFWKTEWPGSSRPTVYYDPRSLEMDGPAGVLHAKAVVADDETVFVTSANLTEAALERNIEIGLLVRDRALAATVVSHFRGLIDRGLLCPMPVS